ncbi:MAG: TIM barrel protein [Chloroflexia bacterium]
MTLFDWIETAALPHVEGLNLSRRVARLPVPARGGRIDAVGLSAPMRLAGLHLPDPARRAAEIELPSSVPSGLGGLPDTLRTGWESGRGERWVVDVSSRCRRWPKSRGQMENYKDGYWEYPEFAQESSIFLEIIGRIDSPWFAVNYDPSNALIAGDDPVEVLESVLPRVRAMHASDRTLEGGTLEDLRRMDRDPMAGYAPFVRHGVVGQGLIPYDRVFELLASVGFDGWVSIEDGQDPELGLEHLRDSAIYLHAKLVEHGLR